MAMPLLDYQQMNGFEFDYLNQNVDILWKQRCIVQ